MGYSLSWLAVKGRSAAAVRNELGIHGNGRHEEFPESDVVGAELPGGWYLVVANRIPVRDDAVLRRLSCGCELVTCFVEEHAMVSYAARWTDGTRVWSVAHDAQQDREHLETEGDLPADFGSIRDRLRSDQEAAGGRKAGVDYIFDVPVQLAESLTGYRHDQDIPGLGDRPFEVLVAASVKPERSSLWKRLFGS
ncbi:MAG: hypothetical protein ACHRXM_23270 [Isosphaerales bacterium]